MSLFAIAGWAGTSLAAAPAAAACAVTPGMSCTPDQLTIASGATLIASKSATITPAPPNFTADYTENVYQDPNNTLCGTPGACLTWAIEVAVHSTTGDALNSLSVSNFSGYSTDIGYTPPTTGAPDMSNPSGGIVPTSVDRSSNGSVLEWYFDNPAIADGHSSVLLVLETSATRYSTGTISVSDTVAGSDSAYAPAALPEVGFVPAIGLVGGATLGGVLLRRRRSRQG